MRATMIGRNLLLAMAIAACRGDHLAAGVDDSTFVATMAALHRVNENVSLDSASMARARDSVLQSRGLTPEQLAEAARALAADPERAVAVWARITKVDSAAPVVPDTARAPP